VPLRKLDNFGILLSVTEGKGGTKSTEPLQGTLDLLILKVLSLEPMQTAVRGMACPPSTHLRLRWSQCCCSWQRWPRV
jgi:hypothetical protein